MVWVEVAKSCFDLAGYRGKDVAVFFWGKIMLKSGEKMIKDMAFLFLADS